MNSARQRILNSFKQGHVLKRYDEMPMKQRDILTKQLEYFEFDMIDLVSQSNQIKWYILFFHVILLFAFSFACQPDLCKRSLFC